MGVALFFAAVSLWAHHSPSAEFDMSKRFTLAGTLIKVDWINPHIVVNIDAKGDGGKVESWRFESNPPVFSSAAWASAGPKSRAALSKWSPSRPCAPKDGSLYGYMQKLTLADGTSWELVNGTEKETMRHSLFCAISVSAILPVFTLADTPKAAHPDLSGVWSYAIDLPPAAIKKQVNGSATVQKVNRGVTVAKAIKGALPSTPAPSYRPRASRQS